MGRAIVREPQAFLMDEPLSNLDAKLRVGMRAELARLHDRLGVTTVYVTHDQVEAMTLGQRVAVMRDGRIQQVDRPQVLYAEPTNLFVAAFIGSPSMNLVEATIDGDHAEFGGVRIPLARDRRPGYGAGERVILGIRPGDFEDSEFAERGLPELDVEIAVLEELGSVTHAIFPVDAPRVEAEDIRAAADEDEETLIADDTRALFNAQIDARTRAKVGERLRLVVDPARFHFFDPDTGESLTGETAALAGAR
jgi:multiple sugar transport system ATP-binding protein